MTNTVRRMIYPMKPLFERFFCAKAISPFYLKKIPIYHDIFAELRIKSL